MMHKRGGWAYPPLKGSDDIPPLKRGDHVAPFGEALKINASLQTLNISFNQITDVASPHH